MAKKPEISTVPQITTNTVTINNNFDAVREAFDNTLSRDGSTPNQMEADIDLNSNDLLNVKALYSDEVIVDGVNLTEQIANSEDLAAQAASSANSAASSANSASLSSAAAGVASGRLEIASDSELDDFTYTSPSEGQHLIAAGDIVIDRSTGQRWRALESGAEDPDRTNNQSVKLEALAGEDGYYRDYAFGTGLAAAQKAADKAAATTKRLYLTQPFTAAAGDQLILSGDDVRVKFFPNAKITYTEFDEIPIRVTGDRMRIVDFNNEGPTEKNVLNAVPTYANVWVTGNDCKFVRPKIRNVPKAGIYGDGVRLTVVAPDIDGGLTYLSPEWIAAFPAGTGHALIWVDPGGTQDRQGLTVCARKRLARAVQGILYSDYGTGGASFSVTNGTGRSQFLNVTDQYFEDMQDHSVYCAGNAYGAQITGITSLRCHKHIALTGTHHSVRGCVSDCGELTGPASAHDRRPFGGISMRNPEDCIITDNPCRVVGDDTVVINLQNVSGATSLVRNTVERNPIEIVAGNSVAIRVGSQALTTDLSGNKIRNNPIKGRGRSTLGLIVLVGVTGVNARGTDICDNPMDLLSLSHGVQAIEVKGARVQRNFARILFDADSASVVDVIKLTGCTDMRADDNEAEVSADWGDNVALRLIREEGAASARNRAQNNIMNADLTKLTSATRYSTLSGSGIVIHDEGSGDPNGQFFCGVPSTWRRSDGGAGTTLYVKESGTGAAGWVGK